MKKLTMILMRHGKAERDANSDHQRCLTDRGIDQSHTAGKNLRNIFGKVQKAIVSDAMRTQQTLAQVLQYLPISQIIFDPDLYSSKNLRDFIDCVGPQVSQNDKIILVIGHNPTLSMLASIYTDRQYDLSTGEYVIMTTEANDWSVALESSGCWDAQNS
jgi:phosphohistidine phosphatase